MQKSLEADTPPRYVVGIDLGTTNSALNFVDTHEIPWRVRIFRIPQVIAPGEVERRETLPSFHFEPAVGEMAPQVLALPWRATATYVVGVLARDHSQASHGRVIVSAKSWLCHAGVDRTANILPWNALEGTHPISPVEASGRYLQHLHDAWNHAFPEFPLAEQDVVVTLPASFDEIARELTIQAAAAAGLPKITLIEEPQAAFYAWVEQHRSNWNDHVALGQNILVIDVGGGTTDLTLIRVRRRNLPNDQGEIQFHRVAVGNHLILGGDNLDLALAHHVEQSIQGQLDSRNWENLLRQCRRAKEILLGDLPPEELTIHLAGTGSRIISEGHQIRITRDQVVTLLVDGFFPYAKLTDDPQAAQSGFQEFSLPYAKDAAVTRYLAQFLRDHATDELAHTVDDVRAVRPDIVLFNGGAFASPEIRARVVDVLCRWFSEANRPWSPQVLPNARLDQAVAHGAAYYGMVRRGQGERIAAGLARTYYLGINATPPQVVCLVPGTAEPGDSIVLEQPNFQLLVSQPAEFPLFVSSTRLADRPGQILDLDRDHMKPLPPIRTALQTGVRRSKSETVAVQLRADLTEIGTLELWCLSAQDERRWRLQFDARSAVATDIVSQQSSGEAAGVWEESTWSKLESILVDTFGTKTGEKPSQVVRRLSTAIGQHRNEWSLPLLRRIWETLLALKDGCRMSPQHESRWLNLVGFSLRPGYGMAVDDWRVAETWRIVQGKLVNSTAECRNEMWVLWRRVAGGLSAKHQKSLAEPFLSALRSSRKHWLSSGGVRVDIGFQLHEAGELYRMLAALELLPRESKRELGNLFFDLIERKKWTSVHSPWIWSVGRLGSRVPLYGPLNAVVASADAEKWIQRLMDIDPPDGTPIFLAMMQLARCTGDRQRDIGEGTRQRVLDWFAQRNVSPALSALVETIGEMNRDTQLDVWGDSLPPGLQLDLAQPNTAKA
ncbi:MAG: Hsp70 family protein [Planctomycetota bacterium]|nr:Hsp70 family protein [Planctomycetota bacterium]MDA1177612.1 Hsp70 family protein [Planctomycetota bacterium]